MAEHETSVMEYDPPEESANQEEYEEEGGFENDVDVGDDFQGAGRGRGRGLFRFGFVILCNM